MVAIGRSGIRWMQALIGNQGPSLGQFSPRTSNRFTINRTSWQALCVYVDIDAQKHVTMKGKHKSMHDFQRTDVFVWWMIGGIIPYLTYLHNI